MVARDGQGGRQRLLVGLVLGAVLAVAASATAFLLSRGSPASSANPGPPSVTATPSATGTATAVPSPTPIRHANIINGEPMSDAEWEARKDLLPLAIMVDNSPSAMPQIGLGQADLVYEGFVEGSITRFMAVFWGRDATHVEPIRSARTPFVIWVDELGAMYAHAGGAVTENDANAIGQIEEWGIKDLTAFGSAASGAYYRDSARYAPYNLVTGTGPLREAAAGMGFAGPPALEPWLFKADRKETPAGSPAAGIEVNFREIRVPWQLVQWHWDEATNSYLRFEGGGPHLDAETHEQLRFKNVIVMRVPWRVADENGHVLLEQFGEGPATVFLDGRAIEGTWKKKDRKGRTRFFDATGKEIAFNRGPIFIEVAGPESLVTVDETVAGLPAMLPYEPPPPTAPEPEETPAATPTPGATSTATPGRPATPSASGTPVPSPTKAASPTAGTSPTAAPSSTQAH